MQSGTVVEQEFVLGVMHTEEQNLMIKEVRLDSVTCAHAKKCRYEVNPIQHDWSAVFQVWLFLYHCELAQKTACSFSWRYLARCWSNMRIDRTVG